MLNDRKLKRANRNDTKCCTLFAFFLLFVSLGFIPLLSSYHIIYLKKTLTKLNRHLPSPQFYLKEMWLLHTGLLTLWIKTFSQVRISNQCNLFLKIFKQLTTKKVCGNSLMLVSVNHFSLISHLIRSSRPIISQTSWVKRFSKMPT